MKFSLKGCVTIVKLLRHRSYSIVAHVVKNKLQPSIPGLKKCYSPNIS